MAKSKTAEVAEAADQVEATGQVEARALIDLPAHGARAGRLVVADATVIEALAAAGEVDTHPDAVAYAKALEQPPAAPVID